MKIEIIKCLNDNYSFIIVDETNRNACVVDPSEAKPIINFIENEIRRDSKKKYRLFLCIGNRNILLNLLNSLYLSELLLTDFNC